MLIIRCDDVYNATTTNATMWDLEMLLLLIRCQCSSPYNTVITAATTVTYAMFIMRQCLNAANANIRSQDTANAGAAY